MASKSYFLHIVLGIIIVAVTSFAVALSFLQSWNPLSTVLIITLLIIEIIYYVQTLNKINRKIAAFFNSIQNDETAINIPVQSNDRTIKEIYSSLNHVVNVFQKMKIDSEFREQLFLAMIEHSSTGFISIDEHGDFEIMNQTARKLLQVSHTSNMDRLANTIPELHKILSALNPGEVQSCKIENPDITTIVQVSFTDLSFNGRKLRLVSLQDIKREVEARENESWRKLIRIMNHEIMNSIAPITSVSKSLLPIFKNNRIPIAPSDLDERKISDTINGLEVIESMSTGLSSFVEQYRKLSQIPDPVTKTINVRKWIASLKTIVNEDVSNNNALLEIEVQPEIQNFEGDEALLNQVMLNLIKNAAEAPICENEKTIKLQFENTSTGKLKIIISNNGEAIDQDLLDKIFIPFFTTKENGAGIGLYISRQIISLHKGSLTAFSRIGEGARFQIEI